MRQEQERQRKEQQMRRRLNEAKQAEARRQEVLKTEQLIAQEQQQQQQQQMVVESNASVVTKVSGDQSNTKLSVGDVKQKVLQMQQLIQDQAADKKPSSFPSKISISAAVFKCCPSMRIISE